MTASASEAARTLARTRWAKGKPRRRVDQLAQQVAKLPPAERERLRQTLEAAELDGGTAA